LADKAEKKRDLERHRREWMILLKYNMKLWTELNFDKDRWLDLVNTVTKNRIHMRTGYFLDS
jgi:hypothetical protein